MGKKLPIFLYMHRDRIYVSFMAIWSEGCSGHFSISEEERGKCAEQTSFLEEYLLFFGKECLYFTLIWFNVVSDNIRLAPLEIRCVGM